MQELIKQNPNKGPRELWEADKKLQETPYEDFCKAWYAARNQMQNEVQEAVAPPPSTPPGPDPKKLNTKQSDDTKLTPPQA